MFSKPLAFGLLALSCVTAAAGGAYLATRHNAADAVTARPAATTPTPPANPAQASPAFPTQPVAETEAAVGSGSPASTPAKSPTSDVKPAAPAAQPTDPAAASAPAPRRTASTKTTPARNAQTNRRTATTQSAGATPQRPLPPVERSWPARDGASTAPAQTNESRTPAAPAPVTSSASTQEAARQPDPQPETPRVPQFEDLVLPASSVIGLQIQTPLTTERARVEDRVDARVTRDVYVDGRVAIPAGSRAIGSVMFVNRGGKIKDTARLGIRFHTLVLADGTEVRLNTEPIWREGESPSGDSAKKIGGGAVVGAVLGGILGGGKGAVIGGITGAGGGTAAVMAGDRNAATFPSGTVVTARLAAPATIQVEKR